MANLGTLTLDLIARIGGFTAPLDQAQRHAQQRARAINSALASIGVGISVAGITAFVKSGINALDNLNDLSLKTGVAVETLAGFDLAAKQSGTSLEAVGLSINKLSKNIALNREEFEKLGITAKDPTEAFLQFADVFNSVTDEQDKAALGAKVLGKSYADMVPLLAMGSKELREVVKQGQDASKATTDLAKEADKFNDSIATMQTRIAGVATIIGGSFAQGFNQLIDKIDEATRHGVTFNNVMLGIGNFAFQNAFDKFDTGVLSQDIADINRKIVDAKENIQKAKTGPIDTIRLALGDNSKVVENEKTLNNLLLERDQMIVHFSESRKKLQAIATPTAKDVKGFLGIIPTDKTTKTKTGGGRTLGGKSEEQIKVDQLNESYQSMLKSLQREIDLRDKVSEASKLQYEIEFGNLKGITKEQADKILGLAKEQDAWEELTKAKAEYESIQKSTDELIRSGEVQSGFNEQLAKIADSDLNVQQKKEEFDKLGKAYNEDFIDPAIEGTDKLSEYAIQAARNMETAFADFLFDPFSEGVDGMVNNFATALRRMAANYLSSELFDLLKKNFKGPTDGQSVADYIGLSGFLGGLFGGSSAATSSTAQIESFFGASPLFAANGMAFNNGTQIQAFANGGSIVDSPTFFKMAGNKKGLMGEAGPEAIIPLAKSKLGKLGVRVHDKTGNVTIMPVMRGADGKMGIAFDSSITKFANGGIINGNFTSPLSNVENHSTVTNGNATVIVNVNGNNNAPDVRRAAAQGAREGLKFMSEAARYG